MRNIFLIATTLFFCGGNAFAFDRSIPCALSYKNYRQYLIKTGATPIKCIASSYLCLLNNNLAFFTVDSKLIGNVIRIMSYET